MDIVVIESPYAGDVEANVEYARKAMLHSLERGEAPYASHLLYTQVWDDADPEQREAGIKAGVEFHSVSDIVAFYCDRGISDGMLSAFRGPRNLYPYDIEVRLIEGKGSGPTMDWGVLEELRSLTGLYLPCNTVSRTRSEIIYKVL